MTMVRTLNWRMLLLYIVKLIIRCLGLRVGVVYDAISDKQRLMYQRWACKNESVLTVTYMNGGDISTFGGKTNLKIHALNLILIRMFR